VASGKPFAIKGPAAANFFLGSVSAAELVKMARTAPVYMALLSREGVLPQYRHEALESLARLNKTGVLTELFAAIQRIVRCSGAADADCLALQDMQPRSTACIPAELQPVQPGLEKLAAAARLPLTREVAYVALITADGSLEPTWARAVKASDTLRDLVEAVPL